MLETDEWLWLLETLIIIFIYLAGFVSGFFMRASVSRYRRRNARKARYAQLAATEGEPEHDGKNRSMNLPAVVTALLAASGVIVLDRFKGPLFPDVFYCLNDGGTQTTRICTGKVIADVTPSPNY
jgi:hypothetical protein